LTTTVSASGASTPAKSVSAEAAAYFFQISPIE
jgi:hypothetical protein